MSDSKYCGLLCALLFCNAALGSDAPKAVEVTVSVETRGYYAYDSRTKSPTQTNVSAFQARCVFSPTRWFMENHAPPNVVDYYYFDGTNTYRMFHWLKTNNYAKATTEGFARPTFGRRAWSPGMPSYVTVIPGAHPLDHMANAIPWLAYCSSAYLQQSGRLIPIPVPFDSIMHSPYALGYRDETVLFDDALRLPRSVSLYTSSELLKKSPSRILLIRDSRQTPVRAPLMTPVPFGEGEFHCRYVVLASTNLAGWNIPLAFSLTIYPHEEGKRIVGADAVGRALQVVEVSSVPGFSPEAGITAVTDLRVRSSGKMVDAVLYNITNECIPNTNAPRVALALRKAIALAPEDPIGGIRRHIIILYGFLAVSVGFAAWVLLKQHKQKGRSNKNIEA